MPNKRIHNRLAGLAPCSWVMRSVEPVEKVHFGIRKILEALYEQNTKNNSISNSRHIKSRLGAA